MSKNLYLYTSKLKDGAFTWAMMPITNDTPILDATYLPEEKGLLVMIREKKESIIDRPFKNERGEYQKTAKGEYKTKEVKFETYYEHFIAKEEDIKSFVETFAVNYNESFNLFPKEQVLTTASAEVAG